MQIPEEEAAQETVPALPFIVSINPPVYPSAWLRPAEPASVSPDKIQVYCNSRRQAMEPSSQGEVTKLSQVIQINEGKIQAHLGVSKVPRHQQWRHGRRFRAEALQMKASDKNASDK